MSDLSESQTDYHLVLTLQTKTSGHAELFQRF